MQEIDEILLVSIQEILKNILGENAEQAVLWHLSRFYGIEKSEIPNKIGAFNTALRDMFGSGALVFERVIIRSLYSKKGCRYEERESWSFTDYIEYVKRLP
ncbi:MAG: hypothetical protein H3Z53_04340 [archaeon]|nr:hypothetical protein [archaeon]MCP8313586.1 hypothetical protein [archaeon]